MPPLDAPPAGGFRLGQPEQTPRLPFAASIPNDNLTERHRPRALSEVVGQAAAVLQLRTYLDSPYPVAFLLEGPTGVGKTSMARALAADLAVPLDSVDYLEIDSGRQDGEAVERVIDLFRFPPMSGGYRVVVVNEADLMTPKAAHLWLSGLESIPRRTVIVFTTNHAEKFPDRFLDRCERIRFASDGQVLKHDAQCLIDSIWRKELGAMDSPDVEDLPGVIDRDGVLSFRRCVAALGPLIRARRRERPAMPPGPPTVAFRPAADAQNAPDAPGRPAVPRPAGPPAAAPRRPRATPRASRPAPACSPELTLLRHRLGELLAEEDRLGDCACDVGDELNEAQAEIKAHGRKAAPAMRQRLDTAYAEYLRIGGLLLELADATRRTEKQIKQAEKVARK